MATQTRTLPLNPNSFSGGFGPPVWANLGGAQTCGDASYASANFGAFPFATSEFLRLQGWGFAIPLGAVINGITAGLTIRESFSGVTEDHAIVTKFGLAVGSNLATLVEWPLVDTVKTWGSATELWGQVWTPVSINSITFGFMITVTDLTGVGAGGFVDCSFITVDFTPPSGIVAMPIMGLGAPQ